MFRDTVRLLGECLETRNAALRTAASAHARRLLMLRALHISRACAPA